MNGAPFRAPRFFLAGLGHPMWDRQGRPCMSKHRSLPLALVCLGMLGAASTPATARSPKDTAAKP